MKHPSSCVFLFKKAVELVEWLFFQKEVYILQYILHAVHDILHGVHDILQAVHDIYMQYTINYELR